MKKYTWDEICNRADGAACGEATLKAKDEARFQIGEIIFEREGYDIEYEECPEDCVQDFCEENNVKFDENGNITEIDRNGVINYEDKNRK